MTHCPFCDTSETYRHLRTLDTMQIIYPKNPVLQNHYLIVPLRHVHTVDELTSQELAELGMLIRLLKNSVDDSIGYNLLSNNGSEAVNQRVPHAHIHIFFRSNDDVDPFNAPHSTTPADFTEDQLAFITQKKRQLESERIY